MIYNVKNRSLYFGLLSMLDNLISVTQCSCYLLFYIERLKDQGAFNTPETECRCEG